MSNVHGGCDKAPRQRLESLVAFRVVETQQSRTANHVRNVVSALLSVGDPTTSFNSLWQQEKAKAPDERGSTKST